MTATPRKTTDYDRHIAARLLAARKQAKISQTDAGERLGVAFQQIQKYEKGTSRITAGNLYKLAQAYGLPIEWFYEGLGSNGHALDDVSVKLLGEIHGADLARIYLAIKSAIGRQTVVDLAAAWATQP